MRNPLQEQLLKAGLAKKAQVDRVAREQEKRRQGKASEAPAADIDVQRLQAERAERDRALEAARRAEAAQRERAAEVRQIIDAHRVACEGEGTYRFTDGEAIRSLSVDAATRRALARGALVIVRDGDDHAVLPRAAADKVRARLPQAIVLDHAVHADTPTTSEEEADYLRRFPVPDDLVW